MHVVVYVYIYHSDAIISNNVFPPHIIIILLVTYVLNQNTVATVSFGRQVKVRRSPMCENTNRST